MTTARTVPVTTEMDGDELDAEDAWHLARHHTLRAVLVESFVRFRYGDGFTNSRALALQICLAVVPFLLAVMGLAADIDDERPSRVVAATVSAVSPASGDNDAIVDALAGGAGDTGEVALAFGLFFAVLSMTTAMAQVERGSNRIYGIRRDRPALSKYFRAAVITAVLAVPVGLGFLVLVAGGAFGDAMVAEYGWSDRHEPLVAVGALAAGPADAGRHHRGHLRPLATPPAACPVVAGARVGGHRGAEHDRGRRAGGVRQRQRLLQQHLRTAGRRLRPAHVEPAVLHLALLRGGGLRPARGAAGRRAPIRRTTTRDARTTGRSATDRPVRGRGPGRPRGPRRPTPRAGPAPGRSAVSAARARRPPRPTTDGIDRHTSLNPWTPSRREVTGSTRCSSLRTASRMRATARPIARLVAPLPAMISYAERTTCSWILARASASRGPSPVTPSPAPAPHRSRRSTTAAPRSHRARRRCRRARSGRRPRCARR